MKSITNLLILFFMTLGLSCTKNDSILTEEKNNLNNDSTNVDDSNSVNSDTLCMYHNIIIDTSTSFTNDASYLIGKWQLISYLNSSNCSFNDEPDNLGDSVVLEFISVDSIKGNTIVNTFNGNVSISDFKINFNNILMTEVCCDPVWADNFSIAIYYTDYYNIQNDTLVIFYKESTEAMIFKNLK